jgi:putative transposase
VVWSFVDLAFRKLLELVCSPVAPIGQRSWRSLSCVTSSRCGGGQAGRPSFEPADRAVLAALSRALPRRAWAAFSVRPETLLHWHRKLVVRRWAYPYTRPGRPPLERPRRDLILRLARENAHWGYQRIAGELKRLGLAVSATTVRKVLTAPDLPPGSERGQQTWRSFLRQQAASTLACDFFTVENARTAADLRPLLHLAGDAPARVHRLHAEPRPGVGRRLSHRRDRVDLDTCPRAQRERVRRVLGADLRGDCLDRILIFGRRHLDRVLRVYTTHHNEHRPHRALQVTPTGRRQRCRYRSKLSTCPRSTDNDLLGGLIHEYRQAA